MAVVQTLIGNVKGPQGETGATGATGAKGDAATIIVGSVSTTAYGNAAKVENVGTENDAILNFTIPQGAPGQRTTTMSGLTLDTVTTSAEEFPVPAVGENGATVWGKVIKFFRDTIAALTSKLDANKVVNSQTVTEAGYALDAQQANPNVSGSLAAQISELNDSLTNRTHSTETQEVISNGLTLRYRVVSGIVFFDLKGNPTSASVVAEFAVPKALLGFYQRVTQWGGSANNIMDVFMDSSSTILRARSYTTYSVNTSGSYLSEL